MDYILMVIELMGALGLFLFGMKILSEGIQRAAGDRLKHTLNLMTGNTFKALLTGIGVTAIIQSSSATTVMVVSFVNAGLLSVVQAAGVIFGANIGTTMTAWIVSLIGFKFKISAIALPLVGVGFIMMMAAKRSSRVRNYGEAAVGFGLLFLGLDYLSHALPAPSPELLHFLAKVADLGPLSVLIAAGAGTLFTILVHSSSASTAVVITLAVQGVINFEMAAGLVLGCNIGTTIDALLASIGAKVNAKRAAFLHIMFNVLGSVWAIILFTPFLALVNWLAGDSSVAQHIAMLHTVFNVINALIFTPFTRQLSALATKLIKDKPAEAAIHTRLEYIAAPLMDSPELNLLRARKEISDMAGLCQTMFTGFRNFLKEPRSDLEARINDFRNMENYADQMREELSRFLLECAGHDMNSSSSNNVGIMLRMVTDLEDITDDCFSLIMLLDKAAKRELEMDKDELESLVPYTQLVEDFLAFVKDNINRSINEEQLVTAGHLEESIDEFRGELKKKSRKRLQKGADVKAELLFIDLIRHIEKIGDRAFNVTRGLREIR
ncbi:MAG: phosphate:sodium symporter [Spirochaetes bacterium GWD1_61_31]|nr:MAG: phosphate:sodium symporter [Spirochaetes bacterium GWB1_60_80]OHD29750.1 MAG: phosphate:sodium symporter [Spirochaetes bacterium GWC1_61_12]OHD42908.1 MAG: phosphate:sodium symporter [Spirochaetes bacterium GWE1_60_18]OHD43486.1 MAG: phosphate:sodium symporter [Spirochaetes bacterium GWD1_61_31]HAP43774.1 phosphate:sodium symporter [Spirochaetaceae bacterium]